jgi:MYXO-CTERM domain-containing protein
MKNTKNIYGITFALACSLASTLNAQVLDVSYEGAGNGVIGEYGLNGSTINASPISGLYGPVGVVVSPVPEPSAGALASLSAAALWWLRRRK